MKFNQPDSYYAGYESEKKHAETGVFYGCPFQAGTPDAYKFLCGMRDYINDHQAVETAPQQFESLAGSDKGVFWDGVGVPPVGCECEVKRALDWQNCEIIFISEKHTVINLEGSEICWQTQSCQFRPIRTDADRRREEALRALEDVWNLYPDDKKSTAEVIYEAISSGQIPHIKLEK